MKAVDFQIKNKKRKISLFDAVGYIFSSEMGYKFLTGDKQFKGMKGVEFVRCEEK